ncbi:MAG TPA: DUF1206 domain-containing protein [Pyrinomonadaceae bacterium]|jgi:hypothetical protein
MMKEETLPAVKEKVKETVQAAEETVRKPFVRKIARLGFYTKGFLFIVIGILAVMVALGQRGGELADPTGALTRVAMLDYGRVILMVFIAGAVSHGVWNILRGLADVDGAGKNWRGIIMRCIAIGVGIFYLWLAFSAFNILVTENVRVEGGQVQRTIAGIILAVPLGFMLLFLIGLITIGAGIHECYSGITRKYQNNFRLFSLSANQLRFINVLGILSFTARAIIFCLVGYFFISAAIHYNAEEAIGIDGALAILADTYYGKTILFITAAGLVCHGVLSLYEARFRRIC